MAGLVLAIHVFQALRGDNFGKTHFTNSFV
jgi:hypothetical protein